jgi:hypothetical protein
MHFTPAHIACSERRKESRRDREELKMEKREVEEEKEGQR